MVTTTDLKKPIPSPFDILTSQTEKVEKSETSDIYNIPIKKIFDSVPKPTELEPLMGADGSQKIPINKKTSPKKSFFVPQIALDFVESLIRNNRPLKSLRFDLEESNSIEEALEHIDDSKLLLISEKQDLLKILGFEDKSPEAEVILDEELAKARKNYISLQGPYIRKNQIHKESYAKIMADFGVEKEMPKRDVPKEVMEARLEYEDLKLRKKGLLGENSTEFIVTEQEFFSDELFKIVKPEASPYISKLSNIWNHSENDSSIDFLLLDIDFLKKTESQEAVFEGLRTEINLTTTEVSPILANKVENDTILAKRAENAENLPVENFSVQKEVFEQESASPKEEVFPSEYEGNQIKVIKEGIDDTFIIRVTFNDKDIALGEIVKNNLKIKLKPEFKAGWFYVKTPEERAFKEKILPFLKTLKS
ncbi:MAG: hypothetical protein WAX44_02315 [Minisyncoccia bacterium]